MVGVVGLLLSKYNIGNNAVRTTPLQCKTVMSHDLLVYIPCVLYDLTFLKMNEEVRSSSWVLALTPCARFGDFFVARLHGDK